LRISDFGFKNEDGSPPKTCGDLRFATRGRDAGRNGQNGRDGRSRQVGRIGPFGPVGRVGKTGGRENNCGFQISDLKLKMGPLF
jgi:hypothetical protein